ncbi:tripartite tricarboxylate transporter TctB family protein [Actinoplanes flavus]|uniref:Tripartite tricarboxylate transporter TctB family protein n=1 Tax=Actinoplanes flavus TaxID=2820290 RepID=A0ABS3UQT8_9ACTN|nr:tripartite tricarboxylate transporter TctB family protein [Actinoplanes flavus]MBO3741139.1 tripartite tricarboxylate transporter TctB family protein [Actinoplanes flavus]
MQRRRSLPDVLAGGVFAVIGGVFVVGSLGYDRGTPLRMGPGYFPLLVGAIVAVLGLAILVKGLLAGSDLPFEAVPWRAVVLVTVAVVFFGVFVRVLGFVPTSFVTALLTAFASRRVRPLTALAVAAGLTMAATLVFIVGLQLRLPLWGW